MEYESNQDTELLNLDLSQYDEAVEPELPEEMGALEPEALVEPGVPAEPEPAREPAGVTAWDVWIVTKTVFRWIYKLRAILLAIPVVVYMVRIAQYGWANLPEQVGLMLSMEGGFDFMATRDQTMWGCIALTSTCLAMMFCSKKTLYPWLVAVVSLFMPVLIIYVNLVLVA